VTSRWRRFCAYVAHGRLLRDAGALTGVTESDVRENLADPASRGALSKALGWSQARLNASLTAQVHGNASGWANALKELQALARADWRAEAKAEATALERLTPEAMASASPDEAAVFSAAVESIRRAQEAEAKAETLAADLIARKISEG